MYIFTLSNVTLASVRASGEGGPMCVSPHNDVTGCCDDVISGMKQGEWGKGIHVFSYNSVTRTSLGASDGVISAVGRTRDKYVRQQNEHNF